MKLHKMNIFLLTNLLIVSSCTSAQMPSKTETIKTDNNKENNVAKPLETPTRTLTLTYKKNGIENPLIPEQIDYIEIIDKETILVPVSDINVANKEFKTQANKKDSKNIIAFDGKGQFVFKNISDKALLNFKVKGSKIIAKIPVFFNKEEKNLRVLIERDENNDLKIYGGIPKKDGSLDDTKEVFTIIKDDTGKDVFQLIKKGQKNTFKIEELEKNSKEETEAKEEKSEAVDEKEVKKIQENILPISSAAAFIGDWSFSLFNKTGNLTLREIGQGKNELSGELIFETKTYNGKATYKEKEENKIISFLTTAIEPATGYTSKIGIKLEVKGSNKLDVKIEEISEPLQALKGVLLHLTRTIPIPENIPTASSPTPTPSQTNTVPVTPFVMVTTLAGGEGSGNIFSKKPSAFGDINGKEYKFSYPSGIFVRSNGDILISDSGSDDSAKKKILQLNTNGMINYFPRPALNIEPSNSNSCADNELINPTSIALNSSEEVFVSDPGSSKIKIIKKCITTFAGYTEGFQEGSIVKSATEIEVDRIRSLGGLPPIDSGNVAKFNHLTGLAIDNRGNIFISDTNNHRIRKITPDGMVSTVAGNKSGFADGVGVNAKFDSPHGLAVDKYGNLFVADTNNHRIRKITPDGKVSTVAGSTEGFTDGVGVNAKFSSPHGIAVDTSSNIFVADTNNHRIRKISINGTVSTVAGGDKGFDDGKASDAKFDSPKALALDSSGTIFVADTNNHRIRKIN